MTSLRTPTALQELLGPAPHHDHDEECPVLYLQPSMPSFWSQNEKDREILYSAGLMSVMRYDFAEIPDDFIDKIKLEFSVGEFDDSILVSPSVLTHTAPGSIKISAPVVNYGVGDLQRLFPGLPARSSHRETLVSVPSYTDENWLRPATRRYFAVPIIKKMPDGLEYLLFDTCFHLPFFDFLVRLQYVFGWPGYPDKFPIQYFPMAVTAFETGAHLPWADLLFQELIKDLIKFQNRVRVCPRLVRIWKMIYDEVVGGKVPEMERNPRLFEFEPRIFENARVRKPFIAYHYHANQISRFTPRLLHYVLKFGACRGPPDCPQDNTPPLACQFDEDKDLDLSRDFPLLTVDEEKERRSPSPILKDTPPKA
ncbi:hypothetical protein R1flu_028851 [Riccia fluitans]|uniref:Uncharacterized protein n=1 Tax=Riccia fluitans TaxID=41844 RepID=A0ABD1XNI2_9MARC